MWTNLGLLYLNNEDLVLANEAFLKAQTLDPDYTLAWVGQGLVASSNNHAEDANALFEHAVSLTADLVNSSDLMPSKLELTNYISSARSRYRICLSHILQATFIIIPIAQLCTRSTASTVLCIGSLL